MSKRRGSVDWMYEDKLVLNIVASRNISDKLSSNILKELNKLIVEAYRDLEKLNQTRPKWRALRNILKVKLEVENG